MIGGMYCQVIGMWSECTAAIRVSVLSGEGGRAITDIRRVDATRGDMYMRMKQDLMNL